MEQEIILCDDMWLITSDNGQQSTDQTMGVSEGRLRNMAVDSSYSLVNVIAIVWAIVNVIAIVKRSKLKTLS